MTGVVPASSVTVAAMVGLETYQPFEPSAGPGFTVAVTTGGRSGVLITTVSCAVAVNP